MNDKIKIPPMKVLPIKKICMTIGQLPTAYLETMSYYEMLIWFVNFLRDNIIPTVNNNGEAVKELQYLFVELQNYVNNYFDNLDVQEEINNKLDAMLEDGSLEQIIEQFLQSTSIWCFDNVNSMINSSNLINGSYAKTLGYYSQNDGGSSLYKIRNKTNEDIIDNGSIISINENLVAELVYINSVNYKQFGAIGDGSTNDYQALYNTHIFANEHNLNVNGITNDVYYIGLCDNEIPVYTNVDFKNAKMVIDDTVENVDISKSIFRIMSQNTQQNLSILTINPQTKNIDLSGLNIKSNALVEIENAYKKQFIRKGKNADLGQNQFDSFRVGNNGGVIDTILWDFETITSAKIKEINDETIEFKNLNIETIVNEQTSIYDYVWRNIRCTRSNTIIKNIKHTLSNEETLTSKPYEGIIYISSCCNVLIENCQLSAHKTFYTTNDVPMGNYDIRVDKAIDVKLLNCKQINSIVDTTKWGVFTSNYSKNIIFDNCILNRFDAHKGVNNVLIENSTIGYQGIRCVGFGNLIVNNTKFIDTEILITLRDDYGSFWKGNIILNNVTSDCKYPSNKDSRMIINGKNDGTHDFGYTCYYPNIYIDGIEYINAIDDTYNHFAGISVFFIYNSGKGDITNEFNPIMGDEMIIKNAKCQSKKSSFVLFGSASDIILNKLYCKNNSLLKGRYTNDYYSRKKALDITTNYNIIIDNVDLSYQSSDAHDILGFGNPTRSTLFTEYSTPSKRLLPNITISNCKNVYSYTNYPAVYNYNNCEVDRILTASNGTQSLSIVNFNNCIITLANYLRKLQDAGSEITYNLLDNTKIVCPANDKTSFNNCYFKGLEEFQNSLDQPADDYIYKRIIFMFTFINSIENNSYLRNGYDLNGCDFDEDILYKETSANKNGFNVNQYFNSYEFSEDLGLIPRKVGATSETPQQLTIQRPSGSETINLYNGMNYINTSTNKVNVYLNNEWLSLN